MVTLFLFVCLFVFFLKVKIVLGCVVLASVFSLLQRVWNAVSFGGSGYFHIGFITDMETSLNCPHSSLQFPFIEIPFNSLY